MFVGVKKPGVRNNTFIESHWIYIQYVLKMQIFASDQFVNPGGLFNFYFSSSILRCKITEALKHCALSWVLICSLTLCSPWRIIDWLICFSSTWQKKPPQTGAKTILTEQRYSLCFRLSFQLSWDPRVRLQPPPEKREGCCFLTPHSHPPAP